uniref:Global nitrogen transcriptional regulator n=1 Tax=Vertebrata australis TaxID=1967852 RepID=A0A1Z1MJ10_9FLOR|nr:global nitrogen transcriptional regulator [Vertebrata australis]ARW65879.1 global nitrogen transcriptional regulator [Vertebrata australis]
MNWIIFFAMNNINYYVYNLESKDIIILKNVDKNDLSTIIILEGVITLVKIFENQEILPLAILNKNDTVNYTKNDGAYYQVTALNNTYLIVLKENFLYKNQTKNLSKLNIPINYKNTLEKYEETLKIVNQKSTTNRIVLFILLLFTRFGLINKHKIIIPLELRKEYIAQMTGTSINSVNKILREVNNIQIDTKNKKTTYLLRIEKC